MYDLIVVGAGAAGVYGAIAAAEASSRPLRILILEQGRQPLQKVRISGGGRCNVTHAEFSPRELTRHYPRGAKQLLSSFHRFGPGDTMAWFEDAGVPLKIEADGRVFPCSDDSQSIIDALVRRLKTHQIELRTSSNVLSVSRDNSIFFIALKDGSRLSAKQLLLATGSAPRPYQWLRDLGLQVVAPVPSLFSFNVKLPSLHALMGLSVGDARVTLPGLAYETRGSLLITHWGLSGPAVLKMSAVAAIELHATGYKHPVSVSWTGATPPEMLAYLQNGRTQVGRATLKSDLALGIPRRLWDYLVARAGLRPGMRWADLGRSQLEALTDVLTADTYAIDGQTRFKEEFVTAGGLDLAELDFRTFGVKQVPGLYVAGELLNIDGVTGGFNFQAAWTGGHLAGQQIAKLAIQRQLT